MFYMSFNRRDRMGISSWAPQSRGSLRIESPPSFLSFGSRWTFRSPFTMRESSVIRFRKHLGIGDNDGGTASEENPNTTQKEDWRPKRRRRQFNTVASTPSRAAVNPFLFLQRVTTHARNWTRRICLESKDSFGARVPKLCCSSR